MNQEINPNKTSTNDDLKSKKERFLCLVGGVLGCLLGSWLLISMIITGDFLFLILFIGGGILFGGIILLKDFFKKLH